MRCASCSPWPAARRTCPTRTAQPRLLNACRTFPLRATLSRTLVDARAARHLPAPRSARPARRQRPAGRHDLGRTLPLEMLPDVSEGLEIAPFGTENARRTVATDAAATAKPGARRHWRPNRALWSARGLPGADVRSERAHSGCARRSRSRLGALPAVLRSCAGARAWRHCSARNYSAAAICRSHNRTQRLTQDGRCAWQVGTLSLCYKLYLHTGGYRL